MATQTLPANRPVQFPKPANNQCVASMAGGAIHVTPSQSEQVEVFCNVAPEDADKYIFTVDTDGTFRFQGKQKPFLFPHSSALILLQIPPECQLDLSSSGGSIDVGVHGAAITAMASGGSVHIAAANTSLSVTASGGSISVDTMSGPVKASGNGGSIHLAKIQGAADVNVSGGSADLDLLSTPAAHIRSSGGNIRVRVDRSAAFNLIADAAGGSVTILPPLVTSGMVGSHFTGKINGGGTTTVDLGASGGSIIVGPT